MSVKGSLLYNNHFGRANFDIKKVSLDEYVEEIDEGNDVSSMEYCRLDLGPDADFKAAEVSCQSNTHYFDGRVYALILRCPAAAVAPFPASLFIAVRNSHVRELYIDKIDGQLLCDHPELHQLLPVTLRRLELCIWHLPTAPETSYECIYNLVRFGHYEIAIRRSRGPGLNHQELSTSIGLALQQRTKEGRKSLPSLRIDPDYCSGENEAIQVAFNMLPCPVKELFIQEGQWTSKTVKRVIVKQEGEQLRPMILSLPAFKSLQALEILQGVDEDHLRKLSGAINSLKYLETLSITGSVIAADQLIIDFLTNCCYHQSLLKLNCPELAFPSTGLDDRQLELIGKNFDELIIWNGEIWKSDKEIPLSYARVLITAARSNIQSLRLKVSESIDEKEHEQNGSTLIDFLTSHNSIVDLRLEDFTISLNSDAFRVKFVETLCNHPTLFSLQFGVDRRNRSDQQQISSVNSFFLLLIQSLPATSRLFKVYIDGANHIDTFFNRTPCPFGIDLNQCKGALSRVRCGGHSNGVIEIHARTMKAVHRDVLERSTNFYFLCWVKAARRWAQKNMSKPEEHCILAGVPDIVAQQIVSYNPSYNYEFDSCD